MNSVRANRVDHPGHYRWSSDHCHATERPASIVKDHEVFRKLHQHQKNNCTVIKRYCVPA
ncbi:MAG: hypothetical protein ACJA0I_000866 [Gammaproteobacteria bacterium]|jgi:hypothetical protein